MRVILFKGAFLSLHSAHFAGGKHVVNCAAKTLRDKGCEVIIVCECRKAEAVLAALSSGNSLESSAHPNALSWRDQGIQIICLIVDGESGCRDVPGIIAELLTDSSVLLVDADDCQVSEPGAPSVFEALSVAAGRRMVVIVQNVHFLPFGPSGTSACTTSLRDAWSNVGLIITVSQFVSQYLTTWAPEIGQTVRSLVVPLTAWNVFGKGPFPNYGEQVAQLWSTKGFVHTVGVLKLTPEKGCALVFELARALPQFKFLAVSGDPNIEHLFSCMPNVEISQPVADINTVLKKMSIVIAPSLWLEAFGMVVVDSMLRGLPTVVSNSGGLLEAGLGVADVVKVDQVVIPVDPNTQVPCWALRQYPILDTSEWITTISNLLTDHRLYMQKCRAAKCAADAYLQTGELHLNILFKSLEHVAGADN